jgi:hypothetical protein
MVHDALAWGSEAGASNVVEVHPAEEVQEYVVLG